MKILNLVLYKSFFILSIQIARLFWIFCLITAFFIFLPFEISNFLVQIFFIVYKKMKKLPSKVDILAKLKKISLTAKTSRKVK